MSNMIKFNLTGKILLGVVFLLVPLGQTLTSVVQFGSTTITTANTERKGLALASPLLESALQWQIKGPDKAGDSKLSGLVDTYVKLLAATPELTINEASLNAGGYSWLAPEAIREGLLSGAGGNLEQFKVLENAQLDQVSAIADASSLVLDPDIDSYYLMLGIFDSLPALLAGVTGIRNTLVSDKEMSGPEKVVAAAAADSLESNSKKFALRVSRSIDTDASAHGAVAGFSETVKPLLTTVTSLGTELKALTSSAVLGGSLDRLAYHSKLISYVTQLASFRATAVNVMDKMLLARIDEAQKSLWEAILGALASLVVGALVLTWVLLDVRFRVRGLEKTMSAVVSGDLTQPLPTRLLKSNDEIGQMGKHFNELLLMLAELLKQIQLTSVQITDMVQGLSASSQEISATANEQAAAVKEIVSTIEDTNHLAKNISNRVEEVSRIATDTKGNVEDGVTAVQDNISKSNEIHDANSKTILGINFLSDKIKNIWDIVNIINSIADQTKIIAFNAELEASSAGEAGKNFQIVASEIRRLADSTVTSTNEIKIRIQEIERSSDALLLSSEQGTLQILQGKDLSQRMNKLFGDIALSSEVSSSSTQQIAVSIRQQVSSFEQILIAIKQISQGVDNFVVSTKSTSGTTENLRKMSTKLSAMLEKFEMAEE